MKQVVINRMYGQFSLSPLALKYLIERKSDLILCMKEGSKELKKYFGKSYTMEDILRSYGIRGIFIRKIGKYNYNETRPHYLIDLKGKKMYTLINNIDDKKIREHKDLIDVVKKFKHKTNTGDCAPKIVLIPDDVEYDIEIDNYNKEIISEKHREWA